MQIIRKLGVLQIVVVLSLVGLCCPASAGAAQWYPTYPSGGDVAVAVNSGNSFEAASVIEGQVTTANDGAGSQDECSGFQSSGDCDYGAPNEIASANIVLPVCSASSEDDCVASLSLGSSESTLEPATFLGQSPGPGTPADTTYGLPVGSTPGLWQSNVPDVDGSTTYLAYLQITYFFQAGRFVPSTLSGSIVPYSVESGSQFVTPAYSVIDLPDGEQALAWKADTSNCVWEGPGECGVSQDFSPGTVASMQVRVPKDLTGWIFGRLQNPDMSATSFDSTTNVLTISGTSVAVPGFEVTSPYPITSSSLSEYSDTSCVGGGQVGPGWVAFAGSFDCAAFDAVNDLRGLANNTATGEDNIWSFSSLGLPAGDSSCFSSVPEIEGMVTTNAMVYSPNAPPFANEQFAYLVAGMHYLPDGSLALGTYSFVIRDSIARCLYGFTDAPISASVSITDSSTGEPNVATTSVSDQGGWLSVNAEGFNFSDPVIHVHLKGKVRKRKKA